MANTSLNLHVVNWLDPEAPRAGGAEQHLRETFTRLVARGHRVHLLCSGWRGAAARQQRDGIDIHRVGNRQTFALAAPRYYARHLRGLPTDVVIEDLNKIPLFTPLWTARPTLLLVHHLFGGAAFSAASPLIALPTWISERPLPLLYRRVPVQAVSRSTADDLVARGFDAKQISVNHNGIDEAARVTPLREPRAPRPTLLVLGRLESYKRVDLVLRAFARISPALGAVLWVAGDGEAAPALIRLAHRLGISARVRFLGRVDESEKFTAMARAWVHVLASRKEGWGITVLEAAARGTPTVASDVPGLRDAVVHGQTGLLVKSGDVTALADACERLLRAPEQIESLGEAARKRAEEYSWDRTALTMELELQAIVEGQPRAAAGRWADYAPPPGRREVPRRRTGDPACPFGTERLRAQAEIRGMLHDVHVTIGALDPLGRHVRARIDILTPESQRVVNTTDVALPAWPVSPESEATRLVSDVLSASRLRWQRVP